jgi:hypothetical protein
MVPPVLLMIAWRNGAVAGTTGDWFNWRAKMLWMAMALRDRWFWFDLGSVATLLLLIYGAVRSKRLGFSRNLAASALFLLLVYVMLPRIVFGSAYADMRLVPYLIAVGVIAIRPLEAASERFVRGLALAAMAFVLVRIGSNTISFLIYDQTYRSELAALDHVPPGARLVSFVGSACRPSWMMSRLEHLPALALVRKDAFSNDQWAMPGAQLLSANFPADRRFRNDPSQIVGAVKCPHEIWLSLDQSLRELPRDEFDYVWLIEPPTYDLALTKGLRPVWRHGTSVLYRVADRPAFSTSESPS